MTMRGVDIDEWYPVFYPCRDGDPLYWGEFSDEEWAHIESVVGEFCRVQQLLEQRVGYVR